MIQTVKNERNMSLMSGIAKQSDQHQQFGGLQQFWDNQIQNTQQDNRINYQNEYLLNDTTTNDNYIKFQQHEQQNSNSLTYDTYQLMNSHINQPPIAPLGFSEIQKSVEVLRRAIPDIMDDTLVDKIYMGIVGKLNLHIQMEPQASPKEKAKKPTHQSVHTSVKKKTRKDPKQQIIITKPKNHKLNLQDKLHIFNQQQKNMRNQQKTNSRQKNTSKKRRLADIWNEQFQNDFIEYYKKDTNIHVIKQLFIKKYPQYEEYFTYIQIRYQVYKILRLALRKLNYLIQNCQEVKLPQLLEITWIRSNFIFYFKQGANVRCLLVELYKLQEFNLQFVSKVIFSINNLCLNMEQDQMVMSKITHKRAKPKTQTSKKNEKNQQKVYRTEDFFYQDEEEQPVKHSSFKKK